MGFATFHVICSERGFQGRIEPPFRVVVNLSEAMPVNQFEQLSSPKWWFETIVEPNFEEYCSDRFSRRKAVNAIVTTYHFWERLYHFQNQVSSPPRKPSRESADLFRDKLIQARPHLGVLRDVTDAVKHQLRTRKGSKYSPTDSFIATSSTGVTATTPDGLEIGDTGLLVEAVLKDVIAYWREQLD